MTGNRTVASPPQSGWETGAVVFAGVVLVMIGAFHVITGLAAIIDDGYFGQVEDYAYDLDLTAWGWIYLVFGVAAVITGIGLFNRAGWAEWIALFLVVLSALNNFFFIPFQPFWAIVLIALDVWVIWALTRSRTA
ncbi:hypothetical protein [Kribbella sp. NPDC048915]|uniref:DUF7144 family membrane protein n=1 Tax=Kribbella sp. NPDC048915 TaxID=3155148 RepID=UPI0033F74519